MEHVNRRLALTGVGAFSAMYITGAGIAQGPGDH